MVLRPDVLQGAGGDLVQARQTAAGLRRLGAEVAATRDLRPTVGGFDVVHLFTLNSWYQLENLSDPTVPRVLSTVCPPDSVITGGYTPEAPGWLRLARRAAGSPAGLRALPVYSGADVFRDLRAGRPLREVSATAELRARARRVGPHDAPRRAMAGADVLLPNAELEMRYLENQFQADRPYRVVRNASDSAMFVATDQASWAGRHGIVSVAARISPRKNQLNLIRAAAGTGIPLTIVGRPYDGAEIAYAAACRDEAGPDVEFIDQLDRDDLRRLYARARVHALPSWWETPGLVSIEAGFAGCNIVISDHGTPREYFGEAAWYAEPGDIDSIRDCLIDAHDGPWRSDLQEHCLSSFTWDQAAGDTLAAYGVAMAAR
jgi:glycosyltransferase involved in cell wall biosynthesis